MSMRMDEYNNMDDNDAYREVFGERLRAERKRLGLSQTEMAEVAQVKKQAQMRYEGGLSSPQAEYLNRVAAVGVNVAFVLTGQMAAETLQSAEAALIASFRAASPEIQRAVMSVLGHTGSETSSSPLAGHAVVVAPEAKNVGQATTGDVRQGDVTFNVGAGSGRRRKASS